MDRWVDGRTDGRVEVGQTDGRIDKQIQTWRQARSRQTISRQTIK